MVILNVLAKEFHNNSNVSMIDCAATFIGEMMKVPACDHKCIPIDHKTNTGNQNNTLLSVVGGKSALYCTLPSIQRAA